MDTDETSNVQPLFPESAQEKADREAFYKVDPSAPANYRMLLIGATGELSCERPVQPGERLTVTIHDADGSVLASGEAEAGAPSYKRKDQDGLLVDTRTTKAKL